MKLALRPMLAPGYLLLALFLGGSSQGIWGNALLQIGGLAIMAYAVWTVPSAAWAKHRPLLLLAAALLMLVLLQLVPLPPSLWAALPGRDLIVHGDSLLGLGNIWRPISLSPHDSLVVLPTLVPPFAMLVAILWLGGRSGEWLTATLAVGTLAGLMLGALQVTGGGQHFYLYAQSNFGVPTGFFANGNHMASLLLCLIPFAAALVEQSATEEADRQRRWTARAIAFGLAGLAIVGLLLNRSLFGLVMAAPVGLGSLLIAMRHRIGRPRRLMAAAGALALAVGGAGLVLTVSGGGRSGEASASVATRSEMAKQSGRLLSEYFPVGTGAGSFQHVYPTLEDPARVDPFFVNHAHNDYLEWTVEGGLPGMILLGLFLLWWGRQAMAMIGDRRSDGFAQAGAIVALILLIHSAVDFPLRTAALATVFAMATGLMMTSRRLPKERSELRPSRHLRIG